MRDQVTRGPEWLGQAILMAFFAIPICSMILRNDEDSLRFRVATGILLATAGMAVVALDFFHVPATVAAIVFAGMAVLLGVGALRRATMRK